ncbi:hypothetical protein [Deinococcus multiflagellatus]|uniref:Uncharacterized protein n=1 Tax=Deinococcus multiflagellatus TaxID=1656887 RepID=A0ABW1ZQ35_9DEIO
MTVFNLRLRACVTTMTLPSRSARAAGPYRDMPHQSTSGGGVLAQVR